MNNSFLIKSDDNTFKTIKELELEYDDLYRLLFNAQIKSDDILRNNSKYLEVEYNDYNNLLFTNQITNINADKQGKLINNTHLDSLYIDKKNCLFIKEKNNQDDGWTNHFKNNQVNMLDRSLFNKNTKQKTKTI
jgi:hypothetical protein